MKQIFFLLLVCILAASAFAVDYGAVLSGNFLTEDLGNASPTDERTSSVVGLFSPWFSVPLGNADLFVSAGIQTDYTNYREDKIIYIPELYRFEFSGIFNDIHFRAGRIHWQDTSHIVAKGNFDGVDMLLDTGKIRHGASVLYTGFLYYDTANINISPTDNKDYSVHFDPDNFSETYFAPRRLLVTFYGEFPGLPFQRGTLFAGLMFQLDLADSEEHFHTQYFLARYMINYQQFDFSASGAVQLENNDEYGVRFAYAASLEWGWRLPSSFNDRLSLGMKWASGDGPHTTPFFPVVYEELGAVLKTHLSGIMRLTLKYEARLLPVLSAEVRTHYFFRTDSITFSDPDIAKDAYTLGAEAGGALLFVPLSDLSFSLSGGVFLPKTGAAMHDDAPNRWSLSMGTILSF